MPGLEGWKSPDLARQSSKKMPGWSGLGLVEIVFLITQSPWEGRMIGFFKQSLVKGAVPKKSWQEDIRSGLE